MFGAIVVQVEAQTQIARTQHTMQVGHGGKLLGSQATVEGVQSSDTMIFVLDISLHEVDVRCQVGKQRTGKSSAQYRKAYVRVLLRQ